MNTYKVCKETVNFKFKYLMILISHKLSPPPRFACMLPASITLVPEIKLPEIDGRQRTPENCVSSNKEVRIDIVNFFLFPNFHILKTS